MNGLITSMTWNTTVRANTTNNGMIRESSDVIIFCDLLEDAVMSSLEDNRRIKRMATNAPPIPMLMAVVIVTALAAAAVVVVVMADVSIPVPSNDLITCYY